MTIAEKFPFAVCNECEWRGPRTGLKSVGVIDEVCPKCESDDTEWQTKTEHEKALLS